MLYDQWWRTEAGGQEQTQIQIWTQIQIQIQIQTHIQIQTMSNLWSKAWQKQAGRSKHRSQCSKHGPDFFHLIGFDLFDIMILYWIWFNLNLFDFMNFNLNLFKFDLLNCTASTWSLQSLAGPWSWHWQLQETLEIARTIICPESKNYTVFGFNENNGKPYIVLCYTYMKIYIHSQAS